MDTRLISGPGKPAKQSRSCWAAESSFLSTTCPRTCTWCSTAISSAASRTDPTAYRRTRFKHTLFALFSLCLHLISKLRGTRAKLAPSACSCVAGAGSSPTTVCACVHPASATACAPEGLEPRVTPLDKRPRRARVCDRAGARVTVGAPPRGRAPPRVGTGVTDTVSVAGHSGVRAASRMTGRVPAEGNGHVWEGARARSWCHSNQRAGDQGWSSGPCGPEGGPPGPPLASPL